MPVTQLHRKHLSVVLVSLLALAACGDEVGPAAPPVPPADTDPVAPPGTTAPPTPTTPETEPRYDPVQAASELAAARERWASGDHTSYRLRYTPMCFCPREELTADVVVGRVVGPVDAGPVRSIEQWFDEIEAAIGTAADIRVTYDDTGAPASLYIDVDEMIADEEFGYELVDIEPVTDGLEAFLDDEYGCGYGFASATADQSASMIVSFTDIDWETGPELGTYDLADLDGTIRFGIDLMANWCDDVVEPGEPEPIVDETWEIVGGSLDFSQTDNRLAVGVFTDVVAVDADGNEHQLGDVEVANGMWGFFAG